MRNRGVPGRKVVGVRNRWPVWVFSARYSTTLHSFLQLVFGCSLQGNNGYDIIIVDSSDPVGPAETLFQPTFYQVRDACRRKET